MRKHEDEQLAKLAQEIKEKCEQEFGSEAGVTLASKVLSSLLEEMKVERARKFIQKRVNHLLDEDLMNFISIWEQEINGISQKQVSVKNGKEEGQGSAEERKLHSGNGEVAKKSGVAKASKTSTSS